MVNISPRDHARRHASRLSRRSIDFSQRLVERARNSRSASPCKTPAGTEFERRAFAEAKMAQDQRHHHTGTNGATSPAAKFSPRREPANGVFVVDGVVGDYLCERYGDLNENRPQPSKWRTTGFVAVKSENKESARRFSCSYTSTDENSNRVGEFAVGTNTACTHVIGNILQDEKDSGYPHCLWPSLRRAHRRQNWILQDAYRLRRPRFRHLVRRRAGYAGRKISYLRTEEPRPTTAATESSRR